MFNVVRMDTGSSVGYTNTFDQAKWLAIRTRKTTGLGFNRVQIVKLGSPRRVKKKFTPKPHVHWYKTRAGHWKAWDE